MLATFYRWSNSSVARRYVRVYQLIETDNQLCLLLFNEINAARNIMNEKRYRVISYTVVDITKLRRENPTSSREDRFRVFQTLCS